MGANGKCTTLKVLSLSIERTAYSKQKQHQQQQKRWNNQCQLQVKSFSKLKGLKSQYGQLCQKQFFTLPLHPVTTLSVGSILKPVTKPPTTPTQAEFRHLLPLEQWIHQSQLMLHQSPLTKLKPQERIQQVTPGYLKSTKETFPLPGYSVNSLTYDYIKYYF